ncbi:MAG: hypothetical protein IJT15_01555 [Rickettsiales bacterium]|nr:hypothetical protein [Rickettsiales bacterium]
MKTNNNTNNNELTKTKKYKRINKKKSNIIEFQKAIMETKNNNTSKSVKDISTDTNKII